MQRPQLLPIKSCFACLHKTLPWCSWTARSALTDRPFVLTQDNANCAKKPRWPQTTVYIAFKRLSPRFSCFLERNPRTNSAVAQFRSKTGCFPLPPHLQGPKSHCLKKSENFQTMCVDWIICNLNFPIQKGLKYPIFNPSSPYRQ